MLDSAAEGLKNDVQIERGRFPIGESQWGTFVHVEGANALGPKIVLAPGLGETAEGSFRKPAQALAALNHDVFALTHDEQRIDESELERRKVELQDAWCRKFGSTYSPPEVLELFDNIPLTELRKAFSLITFIEDVVQHGDHESVDVVGHSQAGAYALIATFLRPELVRKLVLVNPAGQSHEEFLHMFAQFHTTMFFDALRAGKWDHVWDTMQSLASKLGMGYVRAIRQGWNLSHFDAYPFIDALQRVAPQVELATIYDTSDAIFRHEKIAKAARIATARHGRTGVNALGERHVTEGMGHYGPIAYPTEYAHLLDRILGNRTTH